MRVKELSIKPLKNNIQPGLRITLELEIEVPNEIPDDLKIVVSSSSGKVLGYCDEGVEFHKSGFKETDILKVYNPDLRFQENIKITTVYKYFNFALSKHAIEHIETLRHTTEDKITRLNFGVSYSYFKSDSSLLSGIKSQSNLLEKVKEKKIISKDIESSQWLRDYAPYLGLGNYILHEFKVPSMNRNPSNSFSDQYKHGFEVLEKMHEKLLQGEWSEVITYSRQFLEIFRNKKGELTFTEIKAKIEARNKNSEPYNLLNDAIYKLFDFASKFHHRMDRSNTNIQTLPEARSEDAYLMFSLCSGILNYFSHKIQ